MNFYRIPSPRKLEMDDLVLYNYFNTVIELYALHIVVGDVGSHYFFNLYLDSINYYALMSVHWYVPCFVNFPKWSSILRVLSLELWLVLIISI
jgi:hypothetical protein